MLQNPPKRVRRNYARGTYLTTLMPMSFFCAGKAVCPDGKTHILKRIVSTVDLDTMSINASISFEGKTVSGFVYMEGTEPDCYVKFEPFGFGKNSRIFGKV